MASHIQNNNFESVTDGKQEEKKHHLDITNNFGSPEVRKSKKKKKLGFFSFRSKKSKTVYSSNSQVSAEQSDSISITSEISTTDDVTYSSITTSTEKKITVVENHAENEETYHDQVSHEDATKRHQDIEDINGNLQVASADNTSTPDHKIQKTLLTAEADSTKTQILAEDGQVETAEDMSKSMSEHEQQGNNSLLKKEADCTEVKQEVVKKNIPISNAGYHSLREKGTFSQEKPPERPNSIKLQSGRSDWRTGSGSQLSKSLAKHKQKQFAENYSSSDCSSRPVSPVKAKTKPKKGKMANNVGTTHILKVRLLSGENLAARDSNGLSDPYVKFKIGNRTIYKSRSCKATLNPKWGEEFSRHVKKNDEITVRVFDRDIGMRDDFMGKSCFQLVDILEDEEVELSLDLEDLDSGDQEELGRIHIAVTLTPTIMEVDGGLNDFESHLSPEDYGDNISVASFDSCASDISRRTTMSEMKLRKMKTPIGTATVQLVSGSNLPARDSNGLSDPYVKLQLGKQRRKSKVCNKTLDPVWKEEFVFQLTSRDSMDREPTLFDITVWDKDTYRKDDFIGRCDLDFSGLEYDKTHSFTLNLADAPGSIMLLLTLHSCQPSDNLQIANQLDQLQNKYSVSSTFSDISDIGFAEVKIIRASGCRAADICGKSDPFCVIELCNARAQTHTCYKTLDPIWNKIVTLPIKDIHDVLHLTVYDEDKDGENDFLGRLAIPLLRVKNGAEKSYTLKNRKLIGRSKGTITLQVTLIFNQARAAIRTFSPREPKLMEQDPKFKRQLLIRNFQRVFSFVQAIIQTLEFINSCFTWQNPFRSATAFIVYLLLVWNVELYMLPILLVLLLLKNYVEIVIHKTKVDRRVSLNPDDESLNDEDDMDEDNVDESNSKSSLIQRLKAIEEVLLKVQNILDWIACLLERIHNTFTWSVPFLSTLAVIVLSVVVIILYFVSFRTIALLWGINKFTKRLRKPNYIPNNELLDFLSRIPSEVELDQFQELSMLPGSPKGSKKKR